MSSLSVRLPEPLKLVRRDVTEGPRRVVLTANVSLEGAVCLNRPSWRTNVIFLSWKLKKMNSRCSQAFD